MLKDSAIVEQGTYPELLAGGEGFASMMMEFSNSDEGEEAAKALAGKKKDKQPDGDAPSTPKSGTPKVKTDGKMMETEERERGSVDSSVYVYYLKQASVFAAVFILCSFVVSQGTGIGQNFWMTRWAVSDKDFVYGWDETWSSNEVLTYFLVIYCIVCLYVHKQSTVACDF